MINSINPNKISIKKIFTESENDLFPKSPNKIFHPSVTYVVFFKFFEILVMKIEFFE